MIAIDARAAVRPELGGVERYARELCARLPRVRPGGYAIVAPRPRLVHRAGHAWEQLVLPVRARGADLLLCPANVAPLAVADRAVVVLHDAAPLRDPEWYAPPYAALMARLLPAIARRARHVVTVSEFSRRELSELLDLDPEGISVIPNGVGEAFSAARPARRARPYVLCVASGTARKNLRALRPVAEALAQEGVDLLLAGGDRPQFAPEHDLAPVRALGWVPDAELPGLYAGAELFVLPSLHEGFGLPVLEAMAAGTPVVATTAGALPETAGDAARLVAPEPDALRAAVLGLLHDGDERERLRTAGRARAARYSWDATARRLDALLAALANTSSAGAEAMDPSAWSRRSPE